VPPSDLPRVALTGVPDRFKREEVRGGGHWEWLRLRLTGGCRGEIALFDPDHLCPPGFFGRPCRLAVELFHPTPAPNPAREAGVTPTGARADTEAPPRVAGRVLDRHREEWRYTGPVTIEEEVAGERRRTVRHVIDAPQLTLRLVLDIGCGTVLAQLRDPAEAPAAGDWVTLRDGRVELVAIELEEER
jgi:hypothetical protein